MSLTPSENEPDHDSTSHDPVPRLHVLTPYDELSKMYPPESLNWRYLHDDQASCDDGFVNEAKEAFKELYHPPESLDWSDHHANKISCTNDSVNNKANEAFTLKRFQRLSELLDWHDLCERKVTCDGANTSESTSIQAGEPKKLRHPDWRDLINDEQETREHSVATRSPNAFNKTEMMDNRMLFKREKNSEDVRANDEDEITKSLLRKNTITEASLTTGGVLRDDDEHWGSLLGASKSFSQIAFENQTNQSEEEPSSPGLRSWLVGWWSFLWSKVGFPDAQEPTDTTP